VDGRSTHPQRPERPSRGDRTLLARLPRTPRRSRSQGTSSAAIFCLVLITLGLLALVSPPTPASAALVHPFSSFAATPLVEPFGIAIDRGSGDIYSAEPEPGGLLAKFDPGGNLVPAFGSGGTLDGATTPEGAFGRTSGLATDPSAGDLYVAEETGPGHGAVLKFDPSGALISGFGDSSPSPDGRLSGLETATGSFAPDGVAVSPSTADLYVADIANSVIDVFTAEGQFESEFAVGEEPRGIAVDPAGNVYVASSAGVVVYEPSGNPDPAFGSGTGLLDGEPVTAVTIDPASGDIYVLEQGQIARYGPGGALLERFGSGQIGLSFSLVARADGTVYVASPGQDAIDAFAPLVTVPDVTTGAATELGGSSATLTGTVNSAGTEPEEALADCHFDYVTLAAFEATGFSDLGSGGQVPCVPAAAAIPDDGADHAVSARLEGVLRPGSEYRFRLQAENQNHQPESGAVEVLQTPPAPAISEVGAVEVTATTAILAAEIDPGGSDTHYSFQWGTTTSYGNEVPAAPGADVGAGTEPVAVSVRLEGLLAGTTYHFRAVAENANGTAVGVDHTFVFLAGGEIGGDCPNEATREAQGAGALPDCRAYELVTPAQKNDALLGAVTFGAPSEVADDGATVILGTAQCFPVTQSCVGVRGGTGTSYAFTRSEAGWAAHNLAPAATEYGVNSWMAFDAGLGTSLYSAPVAGGEDHFLAGRPDGSFTDLGPVAPSTDFANVIRPVLNANKSATADLSHLLYTSSLQPLWPFDPGQSDSLYEYSGVGSSSPRLVAVRGGEGSANLISECGTLLGGGINEVALGELSTDGDTVFFTALHNNLNSSEAPCPPNLGPPVNELFARIDNSGSGARTVAISQPSASETAAGDPACTTSQCLENITQEGNFRDAQFVGAGADGSAVFFTDTQQLTDSAGQDPDPADTAHDGGCVFTTGANGCNLYLYSSPGEEPLGGPHLIDVSAGDSSGGGPQVQGVLGFAGDGSAVYFVAKGVLTTTPSSQNQIAKAGQDNLYSYTAGLGSAAGRLSFIATLPEADQGEWGSVGRPANVTPDGRYLLFTSHAGLTADATRTEGPQQVYRYDSVADQLTRISIGERGFDDNGNSGSGDATIVSGFYGYQRLGPGRGDPSMSDDGTHVFFLSPDALAPGALDDVPDASGGALASNLYEWEADGTRACAQAAGCVYLLSDGRDVGARAPELEQCRSSLCLVGTDAGGENVFFSSSDQLLPGDTDTQLDYYDARVGGGFAEPGPAMPCEEEACRGPSSQSPPTAGPGTAGFLGPGNPAARRHQKHHKKRHHRKHRHKKPEKKMRGHRPKRGGHKSGGGK
jgi:DNA-binding beta-propeller fold protein YncE